LNVEVCRLVLETISFSHVGPEFHIQSTLVIQYSKFSDDSEGTTVGELYDTCNFSEFV